MRMLKNLLRLLCACALMASAHAAPPLLEQVVPGKALSFPADFGAHPPFRTEWWYATGWLRTPDNQSLGFQVTFFRSATDHDADNPSRFAPKQLIIAHAALSDAKVGRLLHDQKSAREGFGHAHARIGNTDVKLGDWSFRRMDDGSYRALVPAREFMLELELQPTQPLLMQGERGYSRKGPKPEQASHYYSEPHLQVSGRLLRDGRPVAVEGSAWLDHEWSTSVLDEQAAGWDWVGANLDDGSSLTAFRIRGKDGSQHWAYASLRAADGSVRKFGPEQLSFTPLRQWRSARTGASYPVAVRIRASEFEWELQPLQDDQELDSRQSTGAVYWEGAVTLSRDGKPVGRGYLELTGYLKQMKL